ncbi:kinase-like domain-containing protein [Xylaria acuta]|nr:kinase-like domain-containing protein [Xylaria acuta]
MAGLPVGIFGSSTPSEAADGSTSGYSPNPAEAEALGQILAARRVQRERAEEARRVVRDHFNNLTSFRYEAQIGSGVFGVAHSVVEKRVARRARKLVVKRAQSERAQTELRHEIMMMSRLNGSAHIASVIATNDDNPNARRRRGIFGRMVAQIIRRRKNILVGLPGPALVLEYLGNGTVNGLLSSLVRHNKSLPNRLLWSFYLCLVRACVAMKFPPAKPFGAKPKLEEIPEDQSAPGNIMHGDMHSGNVLIGTVGDFQEHAAMPPLKLIDFGLALVREQSDERNLLDVSKQIYYMIIGKYDRVGFRHVLHNGINTMATDILPRNGQARYPMLEDDLRDFVARCLARDPADRPSLAEALETCKNAVETKTPGLYGFNAGRETDYGIGLLLQELVYNAI